MLKSLRSASVTSPPAFLAASTAYARNLLFSDPSLALPANARMRTGVAMCPSPCLAERIEQALQFRALRLLLGKLPPGALDDRVRGLVGEGLVRKAGLGARDVAPERL